MDLMDEWNPEAGDSWGYTNNLRAERDWLRARAAELNAIVQQRARPVHPQGGVMDNNDYDQRVFGRDAEDLHVTPLVRALHFRLCRVGPGRNRLHSTPLPACVRAANVVQRWEADGRPGAGALSIHEVRRVLAEAEAAEQAQKAAETAFWGAFGEAQAGEEK